jgi:Zn-finger nucleic acid-binding protein
MKQAVCEMCGQGELWRGRRMSLVLDHINGVADDHRLVNLRMLCPNCNATLDTHCGRNTPLERVCPTCKQAFVPASKLQRYCSRNCWGRVAAQRNRGQPRPETRKVERPSYEQLQRDLAEMSFVAVGRKYGVSDNAVRKWRRPQPSPRSSQVEPGRASGPVQAPRS